MPKKLPADPADHPTECRCDACKAWWAARGGVIPSTGQDKPDPELEPGAEDEQQ